MKNLILIASISFLIGCGGGGGSSSPASQSAEGLWRSNDGAAIVLDDGTYYVVYVDDFNNLNGVVQGNSTTNGSAFVSSNGKDFDLAQSEVFNLNVSATVKTKETFYGTVTYNDGATTTFSGVYDADYELTPSLSILAGNYGMVSIGTDGAITGYDDGCVFTGTAYPRASGNVYNVSVTFGQYCAFPYETHDGIIYYDAYYNDITAVIQNSDRSNGWYFSAPKL
jgi:hypothetical protein